MQYKMDYENIHWYERCNREFYKIFGKDTDLFIDLLASTSPRQQVKGNLRLAIKVFKALKSRDGERIGNVLGSLMPAHLNNVIRSIQGKALKGEKVSRFARNLKGDLSCVTIDIHMCKAYNIDQKKLTPKRYRDLEQKIIEDSKESGLLPAQYQALVWAEERKKGRFINDTDYVMHLSLLKEVT